MIYYYAYNPYNHYVISYNQCIVCIGYMYVCMYYTLYTLGALPILNQETHNDMRLLNIGPT